MSILAVDIGTTNLKLGVFSNTLEELQTYTEPYDINYYDGGKADIEPEKWWRALVNGCASLGDARSDVEVITLSGTTPGLTAMAADGSPLLPAILFMDGRSREESQFIRDEIGEARLLETTANLPVSGGCSLSSIVWIKKHRPEIFAKTRCFGHSNTYVAKGLTGRFAIDPTSASLSCLYRTVANDLQWDADIAEALGIPLDTLPDIIPAYASAGRLLEKPANDLGLKSNVPVLVGGNDAVLAALSGGMKEPGEISNVNGTCEITTTCLDQCLSSPHYNIRTHVLPERWMAFFVLNTGGKALEWFHNTLCPDMEADVFYNQFVPSAIEKHIDEDLPEHYAPYLAGSRYSLEPLTAAFDGLTLETTRERLLCAMVRGNCLYHKEHLEELAQHVPIANTVAVTGSTGPALVRAKKKWWRDCEYIIQDQSSLRGAAMLGQYYLEKTFD
jgi:xylulokinase